MEYGQNDSSKKWVSKSSEAAPALFGAAAGVFFGDMMHRGARGPVAASLFCLGLAAITPCVADVVKRKITGPNTRRGNQRTLANIRDGAAITDVDIYSDEMGI